MTFVTYTFGARTLASWRGGSRVRACVVGRVYGSATSVPLRAFGFGCLVSAGGARSLSSATAAVAETGFSRKRVLELSRVLRRCARFVSDSDDLQRPVSFVPDRIVLRVYTSAPLPIGKELVFGCAFSGIACFPSSLKDITQLVCSQPATGGSDLGDERTGDRGVRRQRRAGALLVCCCACVRGCRAISSAVLLLAARAFVFCAPPPREILGGCACQRRRVLPGKQCGARSRCGVQFSGSRHHRR